MEQKIPLSELRSADKRDVAPYTRTLSQEEKAPPAETIAEVSQNVDDNEEAKKEATKMFADEIKELKARRKELLKQKRTGYADAHGEIFTFFKPEERMKYTYDSKGDLVMSGRMTADEFQLAIPVEGVIDINKKASNA